jgi:hypothetical protein
MLPNPRAPGIELAKLSLIKEFSLARFREGLRLEYRAEAVNAFHHPHFCAPDTNVKGPDIRPDLPQRVLPDAKFKWL